MSNNNIINEKKKALLAYKEEIIEEIKCYERSIEDFPTNHSSNDEHVASSDSEDDFPHIMDQGPSIIELKLQQAMMRTCLQATQELTSLTVLQSEVVVMLEEPKLDGEHPVTEDGTWREVTAECTIDLVPFTINFFMHTPSRKFAPPSYRGLHVVPVKSAHELELVKSVLHAVKVPSDAIEILKSYAAGYRSRRTTLARLANKYENALFMEPHVDGGFVLKCADLLEVSWRLENKWSPIAPFHHRMKFDLEYIDESYIKIITQAHKQLLDPAIQTDERTLLLAKIISTCLEAKGTVDSDLESKTTERDTDIEKRDSETEKRDSEVMAPPKSLPKKVKPKNMNNIPNPAQKRSINEGDRDNAAKKMRNSDMSSGGPRNSADSHRKHTINYMVHEAAKKRKINDGNDKKKVASNKNVKESDNTENNTGNNQPKNVKDTGDTEIKDTVAKIKNNKETTKPKAKNVKENDNIESTNANKAENVKESGNKNKKPGNTKAKNVKETGDRGDKNDKIKTKNVTETENNDDNTKSKNNNLNEPAKKILKTKTMKESNAKDQNNMKDDNIIAKTSIKSKANNIKGPSNIDKIGNTEAKKSTVKEGDNHEKNVNTKNNDKTIPKKVANGKSKENVDINKMTEKVSNKDGERKTKDIEKNINVAKTKNNAVNTNKPATKSKDNVDKPKNDQGVFKGTDKNSQSKEKLATNSGKKLKEKLNVKSNTVKKVIEKHATNKIKDKISPIINKDVKNTNTMEDIAPDIVVSQSLAAKKNKEILSNKKVTQEPIKKITNKTASHRTALKVQNSQKTGITKIFSSGNTDKENGSKVSKLPQMKLSLIGDVSSKKNLRISPRKLPSKIKSLPSNTFKQVMMKSTNIPRLLKKPVPKITK